MVIFNLYTKHRTIQVKRFTCWLLVLVGKSVVLSYTNWLHNSYVKTKTKRQKLCSAVNFLLHFMYCYTFFQIYLKHKQKPYTKQWQIPDLCLYNIYHQYLNNLNTIIVYENKIYNLFISDHLSWIMVKLN